MNATRIRSQHQGPPPTPRSPSSYGSNGWSSFGEQLSAIVAASDKFTPGRIDNRLLITRSAAGSSEQVPADGGYLVAADFSRQLVSRLFAQGELLGRMFRMPIIRDSANGLRLAGFDEQSRADGSRWGGVRSYWSNEADSATASRPKFRQMEVYLKKLTAICFATSEMLQDSSALEAVLSTAFVNEFLFKLERAALFGIGEGQPSGAFDPANNSLIVIQKEVGQGAATLVSQNILNMHKRLWSPSYPNAIWLVSNDVLAALPALTVPVGTAGSQLPLYVAATAGEAYGRLLGIPCIPSEYASALGQQGDIMLADFTQYLLVEKQEGIQAASSIYVRFNSDEACFRFTWRVDGEPMWHAPVVPASAGPSQSPFIVLGERT